MNQALSQEYHGYQIYFDDKAEEWWFQDKEGDQQKNKSLKLIKNYIDRLNKKAFTRVSVYVKGGRRYYSSVDEDEKYVKATITSVGIDGTIYIVRGSSKHAERFWDHSEVWEQTSDNWNKMQQVVEIEKQIKMLEKKKDKIHESLKKIDLAKLKKQALGEKENDN